MGLRTALRARGGAVHRIARAHLLGRQGAEAIGEIALQGIDLLVLLGKLVVQLFILAGGARQAVGQTAHPVLQLAHPAAHLLDRRVLGVLMGPGGFLLLAAGSENLRLGRDRAQHHESHCRNRDALPDHARTFLS